MTKIIWVTEGLMATRKLAEVLKDIQSRECLIVKVKTVQEAICELFENEMPASLIICDHELHKSIPKRELRQAAELKHVPYFVADLDKEKSEERLLTPDCIEVPEKGPIGKLMHSLSVQRAKCIDLDASVGCCF